MTEEAFSGERGSLVVSPKTVSIGETIQVKAGEKVSLDGTLLSSVGSFNTSALTGESMPRTIREGEQVLAGMVNLNSVVDIEVNKKYEDSSFARVLQMVQEATSEIADVVIQNDNPTKIATAILIARSTRVIVIQNIVFALGIKLLIMLLGAFGIASMWGAVIADVGVSLIAILNSIRILSKEFK